MSPCSADYIINRSRCCALQPHSRLTSFRNSRYAFLMWANTAVTVASVIAVHAENLKSFRPTSFSDVFVELRAAQGAELLAMFFAVVVHMVNAEEKGFCFAATSTLVSAVGHDGLMLLAEVVVACGQLAGFGVFFLPAVDPLQNLFLISQMPLLLVSGYLGSVSDGVCFVLLFHAGITHLPAPFFSFDHNLEMVERLIFTATPAFPHSVPPTGCRNHTAQVGVQLQGL